MVGPFIILAAFAIPTIVVLWRAIKEQRDE